MKILPVARRANKLFNKEGGLLSYIGILSNSVVDISLDVVSNVVPFGGAIKSFLG